MSGVHGADAALKAIQLRLAEIEARRGACCATVDEVAEHTRLRVELLEHEVARLRREMEDRQ